MKNGMPNFAGVAKAYGLLGFSITTLEELNKILTNENYGGKPMLVDVNVIENENCYPMVAPRKK
jgi:acetolactate synthase-1/2/3 large subunit